MKTIPASPCEIALVKSVNPRAIQIVGSRVKRSTNQVQPDGSTKDKKAYLWGYGSGVAASTDPVYGDVVLVEYTVPFNEGDVTYYRPLYQRAVVALDQFPIHVAADAAYDFWYVYETVAHRQGIAAIPFNSHGHEEVPHDPDGTPYCSKGLRMHPSFQFWHTNGFRAKPLSLSLALS